MPSGKINILLIAESNQADFIRLSLQDYTDQYHLNVLSSISETREFLTLTTPELIIASLKLKNSSALELLEISDKPLPCPLILLTEESSRQEALESTRQGAFDYILQDVTPTYEIPRIMERAIRQNHYNLEYKNTQRALMESEERSKASFDLIRNVLKRTSCKRGEAFLKSLVQNLALALKIPFAGVGKLNYPEQKDISILAFWNGEGFGQPFTYDLQDTPCKNVLNQNWCFYPENTHKQFPKDKMLVDIGIEGYMGVTLQDESGQTIGLIWVMDQVPFREHHSTKEIMAIFAARAQMELQFLLMEESQKETETIAQCIMDNAVDGIVTIDETGCIESFNRAAEDIFGYAASEVLGKNVKKLVPKHHQTHLDEYIHPYLTSGTKKLIGLKKEGEGLRKDGSVFPVDLAISEVRLNSKRCFTAIVRDISLRKKSEQDLIEATLQAEKANLAKTEFLSRMSHELRTPLNSVLGFTQLLEMAAIQEKYPENQLNFIDQILKAGSHLLELINEVLDLSRIESGKIEVHLDPVHLPTLLNEMEAFIKPIAQQKEIKVINRSSFNGPSIIKADKGLLKQCLLNILSNAVKYNRSSGEVVMGYHLKNSSVMRLYITDTGPGLSEEQQVSLFEPFERLGIERTDIKGSGIGLTITRQMVELMDGNIGIESKLGKGSTFYIELPVHKEDILDIVKPRIRSKPSLLGGSSNFNIFYIEDNPANLALIENALSRFSNVHLKSATGGRTGIEQIKKLVPDLILLDMGLPDMEGLDVLKELKENEATQNIPIVVLSANALKSHIDQSLALGITHYLTKPINVNEFADVIHQFTH